MIRAFLIGLGVLVAAIVVGILALDVTMHKWAAFGGDLVILAFLAGLATGIFLLATRRRRG